MNSNFTVSASSPHDPLSAYSAGVSALQQKLHHIRTSQRETVESLSRAVIALRTMSAGKQKSNTL